MQVFPDYYPRFSCIASECKHNCCIGWEIDIDEETLSRYDQISGSFGARLRQHISREETPHFRLDENERCPFLQGNGLCELILTLGEEHLCQICTDHPRFRNSLPGRTEIGVGLCCEAAGRLILSKKEPVCLIAEGSLQTDDEIILIRDEVIALLQDRTHTMDERLKKMLTLCNAALPQYSNAKWAELLLSLERLDEAWTELLFLFASADADRTAFDRHMHDRQAEYEQFCVYLTYRHMANATDEIDLAARAAFVAFGYHVLHALGAILWTKNGNFSFADQVELARQFSAELEYSEENTDSLFDALVPNISE